MSSLKPPAPERFNRQSLSQSVVDEVLGWFAEGRYGPDDKLPPERELMDHFGVGRNTVREAMQAMETMGLLAIRPGHGTHVLRTAPESVLPPEVMSALMNANTLGELYEFRLVVEPGIAAFAAVRRTDADLTSMSEALDLYEAAMSAHEHVAPHDVLFHRRIAVAASNSIYLKVTDAVSSLLINARSATDIVEAAVHSAVVDHRAILGAIEAQDAERARELMVLHVESATRALSEARKLAQQAGAGASDNQEAS